MRRPRTHGFFRLHYFWIFFTALLFFMFPGNVSAALKCSNCGKTISGKYLKVNNKAYCSLKCFRQTLPKCAICGKPCERYFTQDGKKYCSKECLNKVLPHCAGCGEVFTKGMIFGGDPSQVYCSKCAAKPKCFSCSLPADCDTLEDGRNICPNCAKTAVYDLKDVRGIFLEVKRKLKEEMGIDTHDDIKIMVVDSPFLKKSSSHYAPGEELGLYLYKYTEHTVTETKKNAFGKVLKENTRKYKDNISYTIYVLYGIPRDKLTEVIAHELAHDWMQKYYPDINDLKIKEGWAEYVASQINIIYGREKMNLRMEKNPDKIYGDGYRMIKAIVDKKDMEGLENFFQQSQP